MWSSSDTIPREKLLLLDLERKNVSQKYSEKIKEYRYSLNLGQKANAENQPFDALEDFEV